MNRKFAVLRVTPEVFVRMLTAGEHCFRVIENAMPEDVSVVDVAIDRERFEVRVLLQSEAFAEVPANTVPPDLPSPVLQTMEVAECV